MICYHSIAEACLRHGKLMMLGGVADRKVFDTLVPLGVCPLRMTGMDTALLYQAAQAGAESARSAEAVSP